MIINFSLENWMSFRDPVTFSMIASRERQHGDRVPKIDKYRTRILPITAFYGGNASGKTNFFKAMDFAKTLVVKGTHPREPIHVKPFRLDDEAEQKPSRFVFELLIDETAYEFSFAVTHKAILEEKLVMITSASEKVLYDRQGGEFNFHKSLAHYGSPNSRLGGTQDNQLLLTNSFLQQVDEFRPVYDWFDNTLQLIAPDNRFTNLSMFVDEEHPYNDAFNEALLELDTGIVHLDGEEMPFESIPIPDWTRMVLREKIKDIKKNQTMIYGVNDERFTITRKGFETIVKKLVSYHQKSNGKKARFEMPEESDGSRRLIDLLSSFLMLTAQDSSRVFVIDEIDRSLHTLLTRELLEMYLGSCSTETRSQLMVATHDVLLMDQDLLRRDEMWMTERNISGVSSLIAFSEYRDIRYDKDMRKSYLQGRLGGTPRIFLRDVLADVDTTGQVERNG